MKKLLFIISLILITLNSFGQFPYNLINKSESYVVKELLKINLNYNRENVYSASDATFEYEKDSNNIIKAINISFNDPKLYSNWLLNEVNPISDSIVFKNLIVINKIINNRNYFIKIIDYNFSIKYYLNIRNTYINIRNIHIIDSIKEIHKIDSMIRYCNEYNYLIKNKHDSITYINIDNTKLFKQYSNYSNYKNMSTTDIIFSRILFNITDSLRLDTVIISKLDKSFNKSITIDSLVILNKQISSKKYKIPVYYKFYSEINDTLILKPYIKYSLVGDIDSGGNIIMKNNVYHNNKIIFIRSYDKNDKNYKNNEEYLHLSEKLLGINNIFGWTATTIVFILYIYNISEE